MELIVKAFEELTLRELYKIIQARIDIFVVEQNCPYHELDGIDYDSVHVFLQQDEKLLAYLRIFMRDPEKKIVQIGRVISTEHGKGYGGMILHEGVRIAKELFSPESLYIEAQTYAVGYYSKEGFRVCSEEFLEDGIPHVIMTAEV